MLAALFAILLVGAAPDWNAPEVANLFQRIQGAGQAPSVEQKDGELANIAGFAYRVPRQGGESTDAYSKRILKKRTPEHPNVKRDQWLVALMRQLYDDLSKRAESIARFSTDRRDRAWFEQKARESKALADLLAKQVETVVEGVDGFVAPLPIAAGDPPVTHGVQVTVRNGAINIDSMDRLHFENDAPPANATRTAHGALKELYSALKQYNISAQMLGQYESTWRKNQGNLRALIPAASPSIYLNELVRAAVEAEMKTLHLMTMNQKGVLSELSVSIVKPKAAGRGKGKKGAPQEIAEVKCPDAVPLQKCAEHIAEAKAEAKDGPLYFHVE